VVGLELAAIDTATLDRILCIPFPPEGRLKQRGNEATGHGPGQLGTRGRSTMKGGGDSVGN
jgi:hypothetical protein